MNEEPVQPMEPAPGPDRPSSRPCQRARREQAALDVLRSLLRDRYIDHFGAPPAREQRIDLSLSLAFTAGEDWALSFSPELAEQVDAQLEEAGARPGVYREGAVYDYGEEGYSGASRPPSPASVFAGYTAMGVPRWQDLHQVLLDAGDDRVSELYDRPPSILAGFRYGRDLTGEMMTAFGRGSKTYAILGQVVAGYFAPPEGTSPLAVTLQLVEGRDAHRRPSLHVNLVAHPEPATLVTWFGEGWEPGLHRAVQQIRREVDRLDAALKQSPGPGHDGTRHEKLRRVPSLMRALATSIERSHRQQQRRTRHAEDRRQQQRPTHKALEDLRNAAADRLFFDEHTGTYILQGGHHRIHSFTPEGRHVTTFTLTQAAVDIRLRRKRWRPLSEEEHLRLKQWSASA